MSAGAGKKKGVGRQGRGGGTRWGVLPVANTNMNGLLPPVRTQRQGACLRG